MNRLRLRKAFTVVEMVIVIAVIAVLATVMIPTVSGVIQKANVSADQQFAASLNIQLALWEVDNGEIENESDLRDAVNAYYKTDEVPDYYSTLTPKSEKHDYHYWYDIANKQVIVKKLEETDIPDAMLTSNDETGFDISNPRVFTLADGKKYLLMDRGTADSKSAIVSAVYAMDNLGDSADYLQFTTLLSTDTGSKVDNALYAMLSANLQGSAVLNAGGLFASNSSVSYIYIPASTASLGKDANMSVTYTGSNSIVIPTGVRIDSESMSFGGLIRVTDDGTNPYLNGSTELHMNIFAEELDDYIDMNATKCVIVLSSGRYIQNSDGSFSKLTESGAETVPGVESSWSVTITEFKVLAQITDRTKADFHDDYTLHIAKGYTGTITLGTDNFKGQDSNGANVNNPVPGSMAWTLNSTKLTSEIDGSVKVSASDLKNGDTITVDAQGDKSYTINVEVVGVESIDILTFEGETITTNEGSGTAYIPVIELKYSLSKNSWSLPVIVNAAETPNGCTVVVDQTVTVTDTYLEYAGNGLALTAKGKELGGDQAAYYITVECGDASRKCKVTLKDDNDNPFTVNNDVYSLNVYQAPFKFTFGTTAPTGGVTKIKLGDLFKGSADIISGQKVIFKDSTMSSNGEELTADGWKNKEIDLTTFSSSGDVTFTVECRGKSKSVTVYIAKGAYNVTSETEWSTAGSSIVLLNDITLTTNNTSKSISYLNGNYYRIIAKAFTSTASSGGYYNGKLISMSSGTVEKVIIDGPVYPKAWEAAGTSSGGKNGNGKYVASGIVMTGGTIKDSYIYGFSSPVRVNGGTVTLENSVLDGGAKANLYANSATMTINLKNMTTVQNRAGYTSTIDDSGTKIVGAGFYIDSNANATINVSGYLDQYNWICGDDSSYGGNIKTIVSKLFNSSWGKYTTVKDSDYRHTIGGTEYINAGFANEYFDYNISFTFTEDSENKYTGLPYLGKTISEKSTIPIIGTKVNGFKVWSYKACQSCSHTLLPDDLNSDNSYTYSDFLYSKYTTAYKATITQ